MAGMIKVVKHIRLNIRIEILTIYFLLLSAVSLYAQVDKKYIRQGNREYEKNKYSESEVLYRKAIDKNKETTDAIFNIGDALYKQKKFDEAGKQFMDNTNLNEDRKKKSAGLYNLGNSLLMANKPKESIEAYKGSLKLNPDNLEAKYNLAYAQDLLKKQEQQQKENKDQDKNKNDKKDNNKNDQSKDNNKEQKDQSKSNQDQNDKKEQQQQQSISQEDAQRLLNALANDEKNVQEKVKLAKAAKAKVKTVKNW
jgi:Ca-activated chloride channel homolog